MTASDDSDARHEGSSFEPVLDGSADVGPTPSYPPEADPDKAGDLPAAEVPGEQADPARRLTGGDQDVSDVAGDGHPDGEESAITEDDLVTPGSVEPPD